MFACFLLGSALAYNLVMVIYRLHFHPLNRFPGPRLAAATSLYEIYFSAWGPGVFEHEINEMHRQYGKQAFPQEIIVSHTARLGCSNHARRSARTRTLQDLPRRQLGQRNAGTRLRESTKARTTQIPDQAQIHFTRPLHAPSGDRPDHQWFSGKAPSASSG
jgi:hypothetical protein